MRHRGAHLLLSVAFAAATVLAAPVAHVLPTSTANAAGSFADTHFREIPVFGGLTGTMAVRFAADGRAFVAEKRGVVKAFDSITDTTPTTVLNLSTEVMDYWDRGLLGIILDPQFLGARPYLYLSYVYDGPQGSSAPVWGDTCASPPGATSDGCVAYSKLVRFTINTTTNVAVPGSRVDLISDWCTQFPSHSGGAMAFGDDGQLYLTGGDGASFTVSDYGQRGGTLPSPANPVTPINPCGDPVTVTSPAGQTPVVDVATSEGGSLRSQDLQTPGDPVSLDGSVIRINPDTGAASPGNPLAGSGDANARRIVGYGFRNPFRMTKDPATGDLYIGDVGNVRWEEINRLVEPGQGATVKNFGWPCYEGGIDNNVPTSFKSLPWDTLGNDVCDNLYAQGLGAVEKPVYGYFHAGTNHPCGVAGSSSASITGLAFYQRSEADLNKYPARYDGALFFVDYSRDCLAMLRPGATGRPDPTTWEVVATNIGHPVDLVTGPHGDLYYADLDGSRVVRIVYAPSPVARATVTPPVSLAPVTVTLDASASTDPDVLATLTDWDWDLDHDGSFNGAADKHGKVVQWAIQTPGVYPITLRVTSSNGMTDTLELSVNADNHPPQAHIATPPASLHWSVGDPISFSGSGTDEDDGGALPASALSWTLVLHHCSESDCHEHTVQTFPGVTSGSFTAPDHEYPSHLELRLTATDSTGTTATSSVQLDPTTTTLGVVSAPAGVKVDVGSEEKTSPSQTTMIRGHTTTIAAPLVWTAGGNRYRFAAWSDHLGRAHEVTITDPASRTATYVPDAPDTCATAKSVAANVWTGERASGDGDVDWFRFSVPGKRRVVVTLGDLPVNAKLDLYSGCTTLLSSSNLPGTKFERLTRSLGAGTYRVRVTVPSGAASTSPYALRVFVVDNRAAIESRTIRTGGGNVRIAGDVVNGTGRTVGRVAITATFRDDQGRVVGTLRGSSFANRLADGGVTPFVLTGRVPSFATVAYALSPGTAGPARTLVVRSLILSPGTAGTTTETGKVRNEGATTASSVGAARTWYGRRGEVLDVGIAGVVPSSLTPNAIGTFRIVRPALSAVQLAVTSLRGR